MRASVRRPGEGVPHLATYKPMSNRNMRLRSLCVLACVCGGGIPLGGCGPEPAGSGRRDSPIIRPMPKPRQAPPAPPRRDVPLDPALAAAARRQVDAALRHSDPIVRTQALETLRYSPGPDAERQVIAALADPQPGVRFAAAMMAGELRVAQARPALVRLAEDPDSVVAVAARFGLHKLGDHRLTHDLERFAVSDDPRVRRNVALVLGLLGERSALKILRVMRVDLDPLVRQQAIEAMWRLGDEDALKALVALTVSGYLDDQIIGLLALAAPGQQRVREHVRALLTTDYPQVNLVAARAMGMLGSDEGYRIAQDGAASRDPQQRFLGALALGAIGRSDAQDELRKLLGDAEPNVQLAAASAILQLQTQS